MDDKEQTVRHIVESQGSGVKKGKFIDLANDPFSGKVSSEGSGQRHTSGAFSQKIYNNQYNGDKSQD